MNIETAIELNNLHFNQGLSLGEIGLTIDPSYVNPEQPVRKAFKKFDLSYVKGYRRGKCSVPRFFKEIDSELKAYLLGFIYADSCIYKNSLQTTSTDLEILELIRNTLSPGQEYHSCAGTENQQVKLSLKIHNYFLVKDLKDKGITYNKTYDFNIEILESVSDDLMPHFIRGFFDGDGSIYISKRTNGKLTRGFKLSNTNNFLLDYIENVFTQLGTKDFYKESYMTDKGIRMNYYSLGNKDSFRIIYNYLYDNSEHFLSRKKIKFEEVLNSYSK